MDFQKVREKYKNLPLKAKVLLGAEHVPIKIAEIVKRAGEENDAIPYVRDAAAAFAVGEATYEEMVDYLVQMLDVPNEVARSICSGIRKEILAPAQDALAEIGVDITRIPLEG